MTVLITLQFALLLVALALAARVLSAEPQNSIALVVDDEGRTVFINADQAYPRLMETRDRALRTPEAIRQVIGQTSSQFKVDPRLVEAVVRVESGYNPRALSPKGAQGLMQLIPATAARFGVQDPFNPVENVRGGVSYLSDLLAQYKGNVPLTLAAYNAGEGAVERYGGIPPYAETRDYVRKVTEIYPADGAADKLTARGAMARGVDLARTGSQRELRPPDNAAAAAPIYQYVDDRGVTHFAQ
jgi:soluble lytic murein transglycosylase-like protein